jgi:hypothetical protein
VLSSARTLAKRLLGILDVNACCCIFAIQICL